MDAVKENRILIGKRIRELREKKGYLQEQFANKIGSKRTAVSNYESGLSAPQPYMLAIIANELNTTVDYLVGATNIPSPRGIKSNSVTVDFSSDELSNYTFLLDDKELSIDEIKFAISFLRTTRK
ncbi:hypothetical protein BVG16_13615 [Paenibacillus selenitireducens]|uniref:HTH cro/C1-type domain-containing protein n=1 Tax=Paenibacillus selenitireducens TaxID=1324314 RepID=A0A1T2XC51_9BACL|nr:helix-turn-helix transcriptional regulator [Paenibacillus selenitireducens]OPA77487.1 hypothetical protein BVG16_13615 [Paenibacillus selenitireducens]